MDRRTVLKGVVGAGTLGVAGFALSDWRPSQPPLRWKPSSPPPSIVADYEFRIVDRRVNEDTTEPPDITCLNDTAVRVRGTVMHSSSDVFGLESMSYQNGTFEVLTAVEEKPGADDAIIPVYEVEISFTEMPDRIRAVEDSSHETVSTEHECR